MTVDPGNDLHPRQAAGPRPALGPTAGSHAETTYYAVGILPPADLSAELHAYRRRHDPRFAGRTMPHLTLKQPFRLCGDLATLERVLGQVSASTAPLPVTLVRPAAFTALGWCALVLEVERVPALLALQRRLVHRLDSLAEHLHPYSATEEIAGFRPHVTLAQQLTYSQFERAWADVAPRVRPRRFLATHLTLARLGADEVWRVVRSFAFTGREASARLID